MSHMTPNLNLFKYDVTTDSNVPFSITKALNDNWDIIDTEINLKANKTEIDNKVSKSGDTMSGNLMLNNNRPQVFLKSNVLDMASTTAPTGNSGGGQIVYQDKFERTCGWDNIYHMADNSMRRYVGISRLINGSPIDANFEIGINANGQQFCQMLGDQHTSICLPSSRYVDLTAGASGTTYTSPSDGWVVFQRTVSGVNLSIAVFNLSNNVGNQCNGDNSQMIVSIPVKYKDKFLISYSGAGTTNMLRVVLAQGVK